jgi:hypothetical protein
VAEFGQECWCLIFLLLHNHHMWSWVAGNLQLQILSNDLSIFALWARVGNHSYDYFLSNTLVIFSSRPNLLLKVFVCSIYVAWIYCWSSYSAAPCSAVSTFLMIGFFDLCDIRCLALVVFSWCLRMKEWYLVHRMRNGVKKYYLFLPAWWAHVGWIRLGDRWRVCCEFCKPFPCVLRLLCSQCHSRILESAAVLMFMWAYAISEFLLSLCAWLI